MSAGTTATFTVSFGRSSRPRGFHAVSTGRVPRVARHLSLAHEIDRHVRAGELDDLAHAARAFGLTRARVTQIVSLTLLAPTIQEEILALPPVTVGRDAITERSLRSIVAEPAWGRQLTLWHSLHSQARVTTEGQPPASKLLSVPEPGRKRLI